MSIVLIDTRQKEKLIKEEMINRTKEYARSSIAFSSFYHACTLSYLLH